MVSTLLPRKQTFTSPPFSWLQRQTDYESKQLFEQIEDAWANYSDLKNTLIIMYDKHMHKTIANTPKGSDIPWE